MSLGLSWKCFWILFFSIQVILFPYFPSKLKPSPSEHPVSIQTFFLNVYTSHLYPVVESHQTPLSRLYSSLLTYFLQSFCHWSQKIFNVNKIMTLPFWKLFNDIPSQITLTKLKAFLLWSPPLCISQPHWPCHALWNAKVTPTSGPFVSFVLITSSSLPLMFTWLIPSQ